MQELTELDRIHLVLALQRHTSKQKLARQVRGGLGERLPSCEHERPVPQWVPAWDDRLAVTYSRKLAFVIPPCLVFQQIQLHSSFHLVWFSSKYSCILHSIYRKLSGWTTW